MNLISVHDIRTAHTKTQFAVMIPLLMFIQVRKYIHITTIIVYLEHRTIYGKNILGTKYGLHSLQLVLDFSAIPARVTRKNEPRLWQKLPPLVLANSSQI
jgi:hypothetical protein